MLTILPNEIFNRIIFFLDFKERLNLYKTCHTLKMMISERYLYEEVLLPLQKIHRQRALGLFKNNPQYSSHVVRLKVPNIDEKMMYQLPVIFPMIKELSCNKNHYASSSVDFIEAMSIWKNTLEKYSDDLNVRVIPRLLGNQVFLRLSFISITLPNAIGAVDLVEFDYLKNAPSLRHLRRYNNNLYLQTLETIHAASPYLKSIELSKVSLVAKDNDTVSSTIKPAEYVLSFKMDQESTIYYQNCTVLEYITRKYTNLNEMELLCQWKDGTHDLRFRRSYNRSRTTILEESSHFISSLPKTIRTLKMTVNIFKDPIGALQYTGIDPTELAFYNYRTGDSAFGGVYKSDPNYEYMFPGQAIDHDRQYQYLEGLTRLKYLVLGISNSIEYNGEKAVNSVKHLKTRVKNDKVKGGCDLDQILLLFPSLQSLIIDQSENPMTIKYPQKKLTFSSLQKLSIKNWSLTRASVDFIRTSLPNVKELNLLIYGKYRNFVHHWSPYGPEYDNSSEINELIHDNTIDLTGCCFDVFEVTVQGEDPLEGFYKVLYLDIKTLKEFKSYTIRFGSYGSLHVDLTNPDTIKEKRYIVTFIFDDTKVFKLNGKDINLTLHRNQ